TGVVAERSNKPFAIDHHGDGEALQPVALADGRGGFGADLVVGELLATLVGALRLVAAARALLLGRDILLGADGGAIGAVLLASRLLDDAHRALHARLGVVGRLVGLALVGVEAGGDADLEVAEAEVGGERL